MIGASVQHTLNFRNLALQNFYFTATKVYVRERNFRVAFQCLQKLTEPRQIDIERRFDHAAIIFSHGPARKVVIHSQNASGRFLLWKIGTEKRLFIVAITLTDECAITHRGLRRMAGEKPGVTTGLRAGHAAEAKKAPPARRVREPS